MKYYEMLPTDARKEISLHIVDGEKFSKYINGNPIEETLIDVYAYEYKPGMIEIDFNSPYSPPIVSEDFKRLVTDLQIENVQFIKANPTNCSLIKDFFVMNVMNIIDCIDNENSIYKDERVGRDEYIRSYVIFRINPTRTNGCHLFRPKGREISLVCSEVFYKEFKSRRLKGVEFW
jgi:predicted RNA-binding protein